MTRLVFGAALALLAWTYVLFPVTVLARGRLRPRPYREAPIEPSVTVVLAAHDEAGDIGRRLANLAALDYPPDRLEVVVASDGSTDGTNEIVAAAGGRVRLLALDRVGKGRALGAAVAASRGEILAFTDANSRWDRGALRALVRPFADPAVGGVAGNQRYLPPGDAGFDAPGERGYWSVDRALKTAQGRAGSVVSATGAIYAIRRELFAPIPEGVTDDFHETLAVVASGRRMVFAHEAQAWEPVAASTDAEFARKTRIATRGLRCVAHWATLLDPRRSGFFAVQLLTHKVLMRTMAVPLAALALTSVRLATRSRSARLLAAGQLAGYGLGLAGLLAGDRSAARRPWLAVPSYLLMVQAATVVALADLARGRRVDRWRPRRGPNVVTGARETGPRAETRPRAGRR